MRWISRPTAIMLTLCVVAGCASPPGATTTRSPSVAPSHSGTVDASPIGAAPSPSASVTTTSPPPASQTPADTDTIPLDSYAHVVTDDLRVRSKPGVSDDSEKLEPLLQDGMLVVVLDGPISASGYDWYLVQPTIWFDSEIYPPFGWVAAAGKDGEIWLESAAVDCPTMPTDLTNLGGSEHDQLFYEITCFGGTEITFRARLGSPEAMCGAEAPWGTDPIWFDSCYSDASYLLPIDESGGGVPFFPTWAPEVDLRTLPDPGSEPEDLPIVEVTGLYDHPAARTCQSRRNFEEPDTPAPDPAETVFYCRLQFVVTSLRNVAA